MRKLGFVSLVLACVACGEEASNNANNAAPDMVTGADMAPDMVVDMSVVRPDMPGVITGPQDCAEGEWFSSLGPACNMCPAQPLTCALLNIAESSVDAATDTVSIRVRAGVSEPVSAVLRGRVTEVICTPFDPNNPDDPIECNETKSVPFETPMRLADNVFSLKVEVPEEILGSMGSMVVESIAITDGCDTAQVIAIGAEWDVFRDMIIEPLACL